MTPRQLAALWDAWKQRERAQDRRAALMPWVYAESHRDRDKHPQPIRIEDFMPGEAKPVQSQEELVEQQMLTMMQFRLYQDVMLEQRKG